MARNDKINIWHISVLYAMSLFIYVIIVAMVSGTSISNIADIVVEGLAIAESILVLMIIILETFKKGGRTSKKLRR